MEPRLIFRSIAKRWWLFLTVFVITLGATVFLTLEQTPIYKTRATYIIRLSSEITDAKTTSTVLETLNRFPEFQGTYSEIAMSQIIERQAGDKIGLSANDLRTLSVSSRTLPGSRILEISVEGPDPQLIRDFATAVGEETMTYVNNLYPSYQLTLLDAPAGSNKPINARLPFNLVLGAILGGFFGFATVLLSSWLRGDFKNVPAMQSDREQPAALLPLKEELELLLQQCALIRAELNETRELVYHTETQARLVRTMLSGFSKNGSSQARGKKVLIHKDEQNETGNLESQSPNQ